MSFQACKADARTHTVLTFTCQSWAEPRPPSPLFVILLTNQSLSPCQHYHGEAGFHVAQMATGCVMSRTAPRAWERRVRKCSSAAPPHGSLPVCSQSKGNAPHVFTSSSIVQKESFSLTELRSHHSQPLESLTGDPTETKLFAAELVARMPVPLLAELTAWYYFKLRFPILHRCQRRQFCFYHFSIYEPSRVCSLSIRVHIGYFLSSHLPFFIHFSHKAASILKAGARKKRQSI